MEAPNIEKVEPIIQIRSLHKVYRIGQSTVRALNGVDLTINKGEFCCIVGRSGSGKSTLLNMMAGLERPTKGALWVDGQRIEKLSEAKLVRYRLDKVGFIFQSFNLFPAYNALDNVAMPLMFKGVPGRIRRKAARKMLLAVDLKSHMKHKPSQMSGGQQQRVGIARALVSNPKIIFADEATGNLDSRTAHVIMRLMRDVAKKRGQTLIMVTHDPEMSLYADKVVHILDGKIKEIVIQEDAAEYTGPPEEEEDGAEEAQSAADEPEAAEESDSEAEGSGEEAEAEEESAPEGDEEGKDDAPETAPEIDSGETADAQEQPAARTEEME